MDDISAILRRNIAEVASRIEAASRRSGRRLSDITLVAISKTVTAAAVVEAVALGLTDIGENRVENAEPKIADVRAQLAERGMAEPVWHMVGHVQSRKAARVARLFGWVQSVDSVHLARKLGAARSPGSEPLNVLLEVNTSGEASKYGLPGHAGPGDGAQATAILEVARVTAQVPGLRLQGLMTVGPLGASEEDTRAAFVRLRTWRDFLRGSLPGVPLPHLSMGMTDDFEAAIEEGATMVRIGRALFRMPQAA
jgi:hypothetical protein